MNRDEAYKSQTYCPVIFNTVYSSNINDSYNLCCFSKYGLPLDKKYKKKTHTPFEFFLSKEMEDIRKKVLNGEKVPQCGRCYEEEKLIDYSNRKRYIKKAVQLPEEVDKISLKLRNFGNHCNLACLMCHPHNSTTRMKELKDIGLDEPLFREFADPSIDYENLDYKSYQNFSKDLVNNADLINQIQITGGEPFQIPKVWQFLMEDMPKDKAKNINLCFDTNFTDLNWKNYTFEHLLDRYKKVLLNVSCDHIKDKLKFIRYPIDVNKFENNLIRYKDNVNRISATVQMLNIFDLDDMVKYYSDFRVYTESYVIAPEILSVRNLKVEYKDKINNQYSHYEEMNRMFYKELIKEPIADSKNKINTYLNALSKHRNLDWKNIWGKDFLEVI